MTKTIILLRLLWQKLSKPYLAWRFRRKLRRWEARMAASGMAAVMFEPENPIGPNTLAGGNYNEAWFLEVLRELRPRAVLIMNNSDLALRVQAEFPWMLVIYRHWPDDNAQDKYPDAEAWLLQVGSYVPDPRIVLYAGNEPRYDQSLTAWTVAALRAADKHGRRLVVVNAGMGGPEYEDWLGVLRPILTGLHDANRRRAALGQQRHLLGVHEYFDFHDPFKPGWNPLDGEYWLIGRFNFILRACDTLRLDRPPIVVTEWGSDSLKAEYHGWRAGAGIPPLRYAGFLTRMAETVYRVREIVALLIFAWASDGTWETFDIRNRDLLAALIGWARKEQEPMTEMVAMQVTVHAPRGVRKRLTPAGTVLGGEMVEDGEYLVSDTAVEAALDNTVYLWRRFEKAGASWWSATGSKNNPEEYISVKVKQAPLPEEPEDPAPGDPGGPDPMTPERWLPVLQAERQLYADLAAAAAHTRDLIQEQIELLEQVEEDATATVF